MPTIFSFAPYIYTIIAPFSQSSPAFNLLFYRSAKRFYTFVHCGISVCSCTWCWLPCPDSILYNGLCKCLAREIEVIMHVRVRLCGNAFVSRRIRESWQLCTSASISYCCMFPFRFQFERGHWRCWRSVTASKWTNKCKLLCYSF